MKSQDVVVALALAEKPATFNELAARLGVSTSEAHGAVKRLEAVGIVGPERTVVAHALLEFLVHGLKYVFPATPAGLALGVPTGSAAPALEGKLPASEAAPWVWPSAEGTVRGLAVEPLYKSVPAAAVRDPKLYELLALVDALRAGRARERSFAVKRLTELMS